MAQQITYSAEALSLAETLERILDKGVVIAGDTRITLADVELLTIKIRLMIASVDKAKEMGISWWEGDPFLRSRAREIEEEKERVKLEERIQELENKLKSKSRKK